MEGAEAQPGLQAEARAMTAMAGQGGAAEQATLKRKVEAVRARDELLVAIAKCARGVDDGEGSRMAWLLHELTLERSPA